ncbi:L-2-hydroxyglutarate oxidase LhgO [Variovorax sp. TBS-050B]|uniref:NAD(P)/FAD-dependent oxidoreductase n=1 Tax=Variovorax sp. TBS-050B TaxID=2940551 RepID=UPI0024769F7F|nr:NAD(P)/FAD-dependent oxidoreductase [Variovorax sp. TBS-050B]MDH6594866.1 L-2-hydroxyglutarate oxidase LhgO [Variovorax sp. TBS-050B]
MDELDCAVIGGGVVGLAVARALALAGREVVVLESEGAIGTGTSSRNSEVIHAGIYYPQGSLKARLCVEGRQALYEYAAERGVPHRRCGKLIVATSAEQVGQLETIRAKAAANGVDDLEMITARQAAAMEPQLHCVAALHSPGTGIVDSHALMLSLLGDLENAGGMLALKSPVARAECGADAIVLIAEDGTALRCNTVVNAAGLGAPGLARRFEGLPAAAVPKAWFAKGSYFTLSGRAPFGRLIYPVPEPGGLGVHLTIDLGGQAKFGPDVQWVESVDDLVVDPARGDGFYAEVRKYWPALPDGGLIPGYAGMRPKISGPHEPASDFVIDGPATHGVRGLVNLFGIESPGLTSCLAIGRHVAQMVASA